MVYVFTGGAKGVSSQEHGGAPTRQGVLAPPGTHSAGSLHLFATTGPSFDRGEPIHFVGDSLRPTWGLEDDPGGEPIYFPRRSHPLIAAIPSIFLSEQSYFPTPTHPTRVVVRATTPREHGGAPTRTGFRYTTTAPCRCSHCVHTVTAAGATVRVRSDRLKHVLIQRGPQTGHLVFHTRNNQLALAYRPEIPADTVLRTVNELHPHLRTLLTGDANPAPTTVAPRTTHRLSSLTQQALPPHLTRLTTGRNLGCGGMEVANVHAH